MTRPLYFIPDWDDLVDPGYDFLTDTARGKGWESERYAHELLERPPYDGILVSKVVEEKSKKRRERLRRLGVHGALRVPREFPVIGDCGAFGYFEEKLPPYTSEEIIDYYTTCGFDFGVSIDHLIPSAEFPDRDLRYEITRENAREFISLHKKLGSPFTPVGAVQGWDPDSYATLASQMITMGYTMLALGGLVRASTETILEITRAVRGVIPPETRLHLFGVARIPMLEALQKLGVYSVDSASALRRAWMGSTDNYHTLKRDYCAIRIPEPGKRGPMKNLTGDDLSLARRLESASLEKIRGYDRGAVSLGELMDVLGEYETFYNPGKKSRLAHYEKTLREMPWKKCSCKICVESGVEVAIFRGNNRNRRRGFHNTFVLYEQFRGMEKSSRAQKG
ncbi:queuine/other tRNA-ribosyltransferase [Myxococcota bacterium]|nr:queuine/other tRNA-ribosyltransferase [Myxococcota bacterium]MBU1535595.1 queuine/other tRNA-ribosyltransferase [Myxococcota bacterium]